MSEIHLKPEFDRDPHAMFAVHQVRKRGLAEHLRRRTAHPATAEEMKAFYDLAYDVAKKKKKSFRARAPRVYERRSGRRGTRVDERVT